MKKTLITLILVVLVVTLVAIPVSAKSPVVKGEVTAINGNVLTVLTHRNQIMDITTPPDFDLSSLALGDTIIVKGETQTDGSMVAEWVRVIGPGASDDENTPEGSKSANSAYCAGNKKQHPHPMATAMSEDYGITTELVMEYYCEGYSMGAILLALKTQEINGADVNGLLTQRANGQGWGAIWQGLNLIGSERDVQTPPGWLHKPDNSNP
jgi:hypothetical protein